MADVLSRKVPGNERVKRGRSTMKRIAFVINSIRPGGPSYVVRNIIRNLDPGEYKIFLVTFFDESNDTVVNEQRNLGVTVIECGFSGRLYALTKGQKEFNKIIAVNKIQIIHSHGFIPDIMTARVKDKRTKKISTIHCNMYDDYLAWYGKTRSKLYINVHQHHLKRFDYCAAVSQYVYRSLESKLNNLILVRNGIGKTVIKEPVYRKNLGIPQNAVIFIYAGHLRPLKNSVWMIETFKKYHKGNEYLVILGKGEDAEKCASLVDDHIIFKGFTDNPYAFMNTSDVYISASFAEGFSIAVLEAMDNGLALFLSDIPSHMEVFEANKTGDVYLGESFTSGSEESFDHSLEILRENYGRIDKSEIIAFKKTEMSVERMVEKYTDLYQKDNHD